MHAWSLVDRIKQQERWMRSTVSAVRTAGAVEKSTAPTVKTTGAVALFHLSYCKNSRSGGLQ